MRIIAGRHRGKQLSAFPGMDIRPTGDRIREALFNLLAHGPYGAADRPALPRDIRVLDAFAGSGALGLEALSRGASHAIFLDRDPASLRLARENIAACREQANATLLQADATRPPPCPGPACDLAFLDAPYDSGLAAPALMALDQRGWLSEGVVVAVELSANEAFEPPAGFAVADERRYGKTRLVFVTRD